MSTAWDINIIDMPVHQPCAQDHRGRTRGPRVVMLRSSSFVWYAVTSGTPAGLLIVMSTAAAPTCARCGVYTCRGCRVVLFGIGVSFLQRPCHQCRCESMFSCCNQQVSRGSYQDAALQLDFHFGSRHNEGRQAA
jgi:hypothetical protein